MTNKLFRIFRRLFRQDRKSRKRMLATISKVGVTFTSEQHSRIAELIVRGEIGKAQHEILEGLKHEKD